MGKHGMESRRVEVEIKAMEVLCWQRPPSRRGDPTSVPWLQNCTRRYQLLSHTVGCSECLLILSLRLIYKMTSTCANTISNTSLSRIRELEEGFSWTLKEPMINRSRWVGLAKGFTPDPSVKFLPRYPVAVIGESGTRTRRRDIATFDQLTVGLEHEKEKA